MMTCGSRPFDSNVSNGGNGDGPGGWLGGPADAVQRRSRRRVGWCGEIICKDAHDRIVPHTSPGGWAVLVRNFNDEQRTRRPGATESITAKSWPKSGRSRQGRTITAADPHPPTSEEPSTKSTADQLRTKLSQVRFMTGQVSSRHLATFSSSRSAARRAGTCTLQPIRRSSTSIPARAPAAPLEASAAGRSATPGTASRLSGRWPRPRSSPPPPAAPAPGGPAPPRSARRHREVIPHASGTAHHAPDDQPQQSRY